MTRAVFCCLFLAACAGAPPAPRTALPPQPYEPPSPAKMIEEAAAVTVKAIEPWRKRCADGEREACLALLARLQRANTMSERATYPAALESACRKKVTSACAGLQQARAAGVGPASDADQALRSLDQLCEETSDSFACSYAYERHARGADDPARRASLLEPVVRSCEQKPGPACLNVAQAKEMAPAEKLRLVERACEGGDAYSCSNLGISYEEGDEEIPKDADRARKAHQRACDLLWPESCYNLAWLARGKGPATAEYTRLAEWACTLADSKACDDLASQAAEGGDKKAHERYCNRWGAAACYLEAADIVKERGETAEDAEELLTLGILSCRREFQGGCRILNHLVKDTRRWCADPAPNAEHRNSCAFSGLSRLFDQPPDREKALDELDRSCRAGAAVSCRRGELLEAQERKATPR